MTKITISVVLFLMAATFCCATEMQTWKECSPSSHAVKDNSDGLDTCMSWCKHVQRGAGMITGRCMWYREGHYCQCLSYHWG